MRFGWLILVAGLLLAGGLRWQAPATADRAGGAAHTLDGGGGQPPPPPPD